MQRHRSRVIKQRENVVGLTRDEVADELGISRKSYERFETGHSMLRPGRRPRLAKILKWTPAQLHLAIEEDEPSPPNGQAVPAGLTIFAGLEQDASEAYVCEHVSVPGLLQTPEYARAVERSDALPRTPEGVARRVELRVARQCVLTREPDPLRLSVILDESILRRLTGNEEVMAGQLQHLIDMAELPNIDLCVLPLSAGQHSASSSTFQLLRSPEWSDPNVVCVEDRAGIRYYENPHTVEVYGQVFSHLHVHCLPPEQSIDLIREAMKEYQ